jgi:sugar phosphate isomerase/epimerase
VVGICKACVDEAYELGTVGVAFLSGPDPGPEKRAEATDLLYDSLDQICAYAASRGSMKVALETFDQCVDKKALMGSNADAAKLSARLRQKHPHFGLMLDLSHFPIQFESTRDALYAAKDHLIHAHMGNCILKDKNQPGYGDAHPRFGIPGGENDVAELTDYLRALLEIGYLSKERRPILSFEVKPMGDESSEIVIANAKRTFVEAWDLV